MLFTILSPAKKMSFSEGLPVGLAHSLPRFLERTQALASELKNLSPQALQSLMKLSSALAELNHQRFQDWAGLTEVSERSAPAGFVFSGDAYKGLDFSSLDEASIAYAQRQLCILSGFYGMLRPLDLIEAYRLEMGGAFRVGGSHSLYAYWREPLNEALGSWLQKTPEAILVNLASGEYAKAIDFSRLGVPVVEVQFLDSKDGKRFRSVSSYSKYARGLMARYIIEKRLEEVVQLQDFKLEGYAYDESESSTERLIFKRVQAL